MRGNRLAVDMKITQMVKKTNESFITRPQRLLSIIAMMQWRVHAAQSTAVCIPSAGVPDSTNRERSGMSTNSARNHRQSNYPATRLNTPLSHIRPVITGDRRQVHASVLGLQGSLQLLGSRRETQSLGTEIFITRGVKFHDYNAKVYFLFSSSAIERR